MRKRRSLCLLAAVVLAACLVLSGCGSAARTPNAAREGVARVLVLANANCYDPATGAYVGTLPNLTYVGSAFGVGSAGEETDVFVTNRHVVTPEETQRLEVNGASVVVEYEITGVYLLLDNYAYNRGSGALDASRAVPCTVIYAGSAEAEDVAVLRAAEPVPGRVALALQAEESSLQVNDPVTALGYPLLSDEATNEGYLLAGIDDITVTGGTVARFFDAVDVLADTGTGRVIQITSVINGGNSGGPLVDETGTVVGINTWGYDPGEQHVTEAYYALRIQYAKDALDSLGIAYDVYPAGPSLALVLALALAAVAAAAAATAVLLLRRRGGRKTAPARVPPAPQADAALRFQCEAGAFAGRRFALRGQVRIGRDPARNDLVFPEGTQGISGVHCVLAEKEGRVFLKDLGSTYGTYLAGGQRIAAGQTVELHVGDRFTLGSDRERFVITRKGGM